MPSRILGQLQNVCMYVCDSWKFLQHPWVWWLGVWRHRILQNEMCELPATEVHIGYHGLLQNTSCDIKLVQHVQPARHVNSLSILQNTVSHAGRTLPVPYLS